ncbi:MAG TPA: hypothetical protein VGF55_07180 [Gemmataceae bacterium]
MDADDYLTLSPSYADALGGLRWSAGCDAVESAGGHTLAVVEHLAVLLEGVFAAHPANFAHVLHLLKLTTRGGPRDPDGPLARLHAAFLAAAGPGTSRNLGVLFAHLCRNLPHVAAPPKPAAVQLDLKRRVLFPEPSDPRRAEKPPLGPDEFERRLAAAVADYDVPTLAHWIRHGGPPAGRAGQKLAAVVKEPPQRVEPLTAVLRRRPRLAGAVALAPTLDAALALPPRRRRPDAVPQGGYAGVVTRGDPERLLPSQFALDPLDFVRRFAEHELLYFRREEPHRGDRPERVVVFDQGVRTWGGVRVALAAAVVALIGKDRTKAGPLRLAVTSADRPPFDPADLAPDALADLLEASDLTPHPAAGLGAALRAEVKERPRDVVLLTHPRSLAEPAVRAAAAGRRPADRLFALAVDEDGRAELGEWRSGGVVRVRSFRVDLTDRPADRPSARPAAPPLAVEVWQPWTGGVEPISYPFRPGLLGVPQGLAFDAVGEHLLVLGPNGLLHLAKLDGSAPAVLPRAMFNGMPLTAVEAILGVDGGFVACGRVVLRPPLGTFNFDSSKPPGQTAPDAWNVVAHYDLVRRHVIVHGLGVAADRAGQWYAFPDLNAVVLRAGPGGQVLDLSTGGQFRPDRSGREGVERVREAWERARMLDLPPPWVVILGPWCGQAPDHGPWLDRQDDSLALGGVDPPWGKFTPVSDGLPVLRDTIKSVTDRAQLAGKVLAFCVTPEGQPNRSRLVLFRGPEWCVLAEYDQGFRSLLFQLSPDGRRLARQPQEHTVLIDDTVPPEPIASLGPARGHPGLSVQLERSWLKVGVGKIVHTFTLDTAVMHHGCTRRQESLGAATATPATAVPAACGYDPQRFFIAAARSPWTAVVDRWGQVLLLDRDGDLAAHLLVRRGLAAIVLPDGTRWGAPALLGGAETPGAAEKVGRALQLAAGR